MCIICNCHPDHEHEADAYLAAHHRAAKAMREAEVAMERISRVAKPETRKRYSATHKMMVRLRKDWNRLEETRETHDGLNTFGDRLED